MAQRIPLGKALVASTPSASIRIRLADPPFLFVMPLKDSNGTTVTGTVAIEQSMDSYPDSAQFAEVSGGSGVSDANAQWISLLTLAPGDQVEWRNPLFRIRVNPANVTAGNPNVYMLEGVRSLKTQKTRPQKVRQTQTEKA